jgi:hypothetical protein
MHNTRRQQSKSQSGTRRNKNAVSPNHSISPEYYSPKSTPLMRTTAAKRIGEFMKTHRTKITARFLSHICTSSGECMIFGKESSRIIKYFDFKTFAFSQQPIKRLPLGNNINGIVAVVPYERHNYKASALLKLSQSDTADNLFYEYLVGTFINTHVDKFPCFTTTYGAYYTNRKYVDQIADHTKEVIMSSFHPNKFALIKIRNTAQAIYNDHILSIACAYPTRICILTQYFDNAVSMYQYIKDNAAEAKTHICTWLYQVYAPLATMRNIFTHYDLHTHNVMIIPMPPNTYIQFHYHPVDKEDPVVSFKSSVLVKIIDYGRCFFSQGPGNSSRDIEPVLKQQNCDTDNGFWFNKRPDINVRSTTRNWTADLRLGYMALNQTDHRLKNNLPNPGKKWDHNISELPSKPTNQINNVLDMRNSLADVIYDDANYDDELTNELAYSNHTRLGEIHVYNDGLRPAVFNA